MSENWETALGAGMKRQYPVRKPRLQPIRAIRRHIGAAEAVDQTFPNIIGVGLPVVLIATQAMNQGLAISGAEMK